MNPESLRVLLFSQWKAALTLAPVYMFVRFHLHAELSNGSGSLGWVTRTHTQRHTHTRSVAAFLPSFAVSSPSSPVVNKSRFHKAGCDRHSLKQTFHSALAAPLLSYSHRKQAHVCSGLFSLYILAINVNWCWSWCPIKSLKKKKTKLEMPGHLYCCSGTSVMQNRGTTEFIWITEEMISLLRLPGAERALCLYRHGCQRQNTAERPCWDGVEKTQ